MLSERLEASIRRYSWVGMNKLRRHVAEDFCHQAARLRYHLPRGVILLVTGFCVGSFTETDGPAGTLSVGLALRALGHTPVIVTDEYCRGVFEAEGLPVVYFPMDGGEEDARALLKQYHPVGLFSLERCGCNERNDYANMRGVSIRGNTAPIDLLFTLSRGLVPSVGVGDGGNEIGMGNLAGVIADELSLVPCVVPVDSLVIATVSNWGGYGICACLEEMTEQPLTPSFEQIHAFMERACGLGCVDGISRLPELSAFGLPPEVTHAILDAPKAA